ncbi:MAG: ABC transporter permease [Lachnospiraceae bacterium]|nr:ABC transporter permease [Lachnospiraceae bacterium]
MKAVLKKELRGYLTNMTGAVALAVMLLVLGLMFRYYNLYYGVLTLRYTISSSLLIFYIIVPVLSMRIFAEEKRQRTDQLLLTSPGSLLSIVMGKYLAELLIFVMPLLILCLCPLFMNAYGAEPLVWDYACIFAFFLMGAAYLSVGMFISACTESAIIAGVLSIVFVITTQLLSSIFTIISSSELGSLLFLLVLCVLAALLLYFMTKHYFISLGMGAVLALFCILGYYLKPDWFGGKTESVLRILDFSTHFEDFIAGSFSLSNAVFFLSYAVIGIVLTVQALEKRRWS